MKSRILHSLDIIFRYNLKYNNYCHSFKKFINRRIIEHINMYIFKIINNYLFIYKIVVLILLFFGELQNYFS